MAGIDASIGFSIVIDAPGNIYSTGVFKGTVDFDPGTGVYNLTAGRIYNNMYISKLDASGNFIWAKQWGNLSTGNTVTGVSIKLDASANIYFTGHFKGTIDFDPGPGIYDLTAIGLYVDMFVCKLDKDGNFIWAKHIGGPGNETYGANISLDAFGNIYTTGGFNGIVDFDPGTNTYNLSSTGEYDIFVHKMSKCTNSTFSTLTVTDCKNYILNRITYSASGVYTQTILNTAGCDSIITLNLTIIRIITTHNVSACTGYTWNGNTYNSSGTYSDTLITANGCDSVIILNLTINRIYANVNASSCNSYSWHGQTYNTSGNYTDTVITASACDSIITLHLAILPKSFSTITQSICNGQTYGGHNSSGTFIDILVAANGCDSVRTLLLTVLSKPVPYLGADTSICNGGSIKLYPGSFDTYTWQDGSAQNYFTAKQAGVYSVVVTNGCGAASDAIVIKEGICDIYFPAAFTPNEDGKNDLFKILGAQNITGYHLIVYNRYGQKVFETTDPATGWDGKYKGKLQGNGVYVWQCDFKKSGMPNKMTGAVILLK